jgi:hypothetical protein
VIVLPAVQRSGSWPIFPVKARGGRAVECLTGRPLIIIVVYGHWHAFRDTS